MEFCAVPADAAAHPHKQFCTDQHAQRRGQEIEPKRMPVASSKCRAKGRRGVHAHSGERCFKRDEDRVKCADKIGRVTRHYVVIRSDQNGEHQGRQVMRQVEASVLDAGRRLVDAGWTVEEVADTPPLNESPDVQEWLWLADGFTQLADAAERDGDPGALAVMAFARPRTKTYPADAVVRALIQRATVTRKWQQFL